MLDHSALSVLVYSCTAPENACAAQVVHCSIATTRLNAAFGAHDWHRSLARNGLLFDVARIDLQRSMNTASNRRAIISLLE